MCVYSSCTLCHHTISLMLQVNTQTRSMCNFGTGVQALDDFESLRLSGDLRIVAGNTANLNFITASVGALFESFPLVFLAYTDRSGDSYIVGVSNYTYTYAYA